MHSSVVQWGAAKIARYDLAGADTLEVGSLDVNGSLRRFFNGYYLGTDMRKGPNVDEVCNAHHLPVLNRKFDVVVCTEMLEHDDLPWISVGQMYHVTHPGGKLLLTCRGYDERGCFQLHGYPQDFYRYSVEGIWKLLEWCGWHPLEVIKDPEEPGVFAFAHKPFTF